MLVVDDDPLNRLIATKVLQSNGYEVLAVTCGRAAVEAVGARRYALVLMDVGLPDMSGLEATRQIRLIEAGRGRWRTEIVALTGHAAAEYVARCLDAGMDGYQEKPLGRRVLVDLAGAARGRAWRRVLVVTNVG